MKKRDRALMKQLHDRAEEGDLDAAAVLVDLVAMQGPQHAERAERLHQAVLKRDRQQITFSLLGIQRQFLARGLPCLPNRMAVRELVTAEYGFVEGRRHTAMLWRSLVDACRILTTQTVEDAMRVADDVLNGHGFEELRVPVRRGPLREWKFLYVNRGDPYVATLLYDKQAGRFFVTGWGDVVERLERRFGQREE